MQLKALEKTRKWAFVFFPNIWNMLIYCFLFLQQPLTSCNAIKWLTVAHHRKVFFEWKLCYFRMFIICKWKTLKICIILINYVLYWNIIDLRWQTSSSWLTQMMIKIHVVIKIKASSDSPQTLRGNVYIIKERVVLVALNLVDSG